MRNFFIATSFLISIGIAAGAQAHKSAPGGKHEVVEASRQVTRIKGSNSTFTQYRFVIVWNAPEPPATGLFYRSGNEWKETSLARPERRQFSPNSQYYMMVENNIQPKDIKAGDRIIITSHRHDHDEEEMPAAVRGMAKQGLFYATGSGKNLSWKLIPIKITTLPERQQ